MGGIRCRYMNARCGDRRHQLRRAREGAVDVALEVAAAEKRKKLRMPHEVVVRRESRRDQVCKVERTRTTLRCIRGETV
jgi:hypothetical protein